MNIFSIKFLKPAIVIAALAAGGIAYLVSQKNDSPVEQAAEAVLRTQGIDVDISPND
jgi:hypothetical protein